MHKPDNAFENLLALLDRKTKFLQPSFTSYGPQYNPRPLRIDSNSNHIKLPENPPTISIVIPSLNQGRYLEQALRSLIDQQYPYLELIVVDGGSTDGSVEILKNHSSQLRWWCSEEDSGQAQGLNKGFAQTSGDIMAWLNSDDQLAPGALASVAAYMSRNPQVDVVYGNRILVDQEGREVGRWILPPHNSRALRLLDLIPQETIFWRRTMWEKIGGKINENFHFAMDWDLLLRFWDAKAAMERLPRFLGLFRVHSGQKTCAQRDIGLREISGLRKRYLGTSPFKYVIFLETALYLVSARLLELFWKAGLIRCD
jgi:glycosyltransferase involved in cell wall biosynthesis